MNTKTLKLMTAGLFIAAAIPVGAQEFKVNVNTDREPIAAGPFVPTWESLEKYDCPEWFRDAKFGIWAHWGPQCQPEFGDWFARNMYIQGNGQHTYSKISRGPQSVFGFKDWIREWKAENWDPEQLIELYVECGAKYFFALANHHDNFDLFDSQYQEWNSVDLGPKKDIVGGWATACRKFELPLGVSVHASHAWTWYETSRGADTNGVFKNVPYDGWLTREQGAGTWWEGLDPQELYAQNHPLSKNNRSWDWNEDEVVLPNQAYCDKFYNRTIDLINRYDPALIYFDDTVLPLYPFCDAGLNITAHIYNKSLREHNGVNQAVVTGKVLPESHRGSITWDVERGAPDQIIPEPWQTCTCIGDWHYNKNVYFDDRYKSADRVIKMLVDVVSKNGNLLLSVPLKGDGTLDPTEVRIVKEIGAWMQVNGESIYGTRPWIRFGEGPSSENKNPIRAQGFNEGRLRYSPEDIRFATKGELLYATLMGIPETGKTIVIKSLSNASSVELLGSGKVSFKKSPEGLAVRLPDSYPNSIALVLKIVRPAASK
ncbi:MAG: alpha-L-fucosidase [Candidatus Cryptobacteroides sp.]|jgi:alpha-L-fucosidase